MVQPVSALTLQGVSKRFRKGKDEYVDALVDLNLRVEVGECLAVIGESGSGKSTLARILMGLETADSGLIEVNGVHPTQAKRGGGDGGVAIVLQDPADSLDPRYKVFSAIAEPLTIGRRRLSKAEIRDRVMQAMHSVRLSDTLAESRVSRLSGGQQQRVGIARALVTRPSLLILDEPTSALDPSVQAQILDLLQGLQRSERLSMLLITHDLAVAAYLSERICVLRNGRIVEIGDAMELWHRARHPYTRALMRASSLDTRVEAGSAMPAPLSSAELAAARRHCEFADICGAERATTCDGATRELVEVKDGHLVAACCTLSDHIVQR